MFWLTVVTPVVVVLVLWPWRWVFRDDGPWGGGAQFDRIAPVVLGAAVAAFVVIWQFTTMAGDPHLNVIGIGLDLFAFVLVCRFLWFTIDDRVMSVTGDESG